MIVAHSIIEQVIFMSVWERRMEILYGEGSACKVSQNDPTLKCEANGN